MNSKALNPHKNLFFILYALLLGYSTTALSQATPVVSVRFANPNYDCALDHYCVDVEFLSNTAGVEIFGMNVRFFYPDNILELVLPPNGPAFSDFQGGYGPILPDPPTVVNSPFAGPALFNFVGSADFVNGAIQLLNPNSPPILLNTVTWTKLFQVCFTVDNPGPDIQNFCPPLVWDLEVNPSDGGFLLGDDGVVITLVDQTMVNESVPSDENVFQFNWAYSGPGTPPYGMPVPTICTTLDCSPMLMCAADVTIECDESTAPAHTGFATATDICAGDITISFGDMVTTGNCPNNFTITRTWTATNTCDLTDMCVQLLTVNDVTAPSITCPTNITVQCAGQVPPNNPASVGATDNCGGSVSVSFVGDAISNQTCVNRFTLTRTYRATDVCGNSATCNQIITVYDGIAPAISACATTRNIEGCNTSAITGPVFSTISATSSEAEFENATNMGNASDNCGISSVTYIDVAMGTCPTVVTRRWTVGDACGNTSTCNQTINVDDTVSPTITACAVTRNIEGCNTSAITNPPFSTISVASSEAVFENAPNLGNASDACGIASVTYIDVAAGTCPTVVTRKWTVSDACGNSSTCNQTINVDDNTVPVCVTRNITISIDYASGFTNVTPEQINNGSSDLCSSVTLGLSPNSFTCMNVGSNIVTLSVTDFCNNTSTCTATVTVEPCWNPCITIVGCVNLEGAAANPNGSANYVVPMRTSLNNLLVLPGQTYLDPFFGVPHFTPPGQPYCTPPWNYCGLEGAAFNSMGIPGNAGYPSTVVDWVLVSIRATPTNTVPLCQAAALLHSDGHLQFIQPFNCCNLNLLSSYYLVIEHRNHLIVMSHAPVPIVPGVVQSTLTYSFCNQQSYLLDPIFINVFARQKEILPGVFAMFAGNGYQITSIAATNIDADDLTIWLDDNGDVGAYRYGDYNLNADTNGNDRVAWERNNGKFTSVPR